MELILSTLAHNNVFIREWLNGVLIPLNISMMAIIMYTVWRQTRFSWGWTKYPGANSACALWWIFFADLLRSSMAWQLLRHANMRLLDQTPIYTMIYMAAGIIALLATLRCIWCLTPIKGRHLTWVGALLFTITFVLIAYVGVLDGY